MIRNAWYAVAAVSEADTGWFTVQLLGQSLLVVRMDHGGWRAVGRYCPHRGCDLSLGKEEDGLLVCPFHGWAFDATGACVRVPANTEGQAIPKAARLTVFPVREMAGLIWVRARPEADGAAAPPHIPLSLFPELGNPDYQGCTFSATWNAHFTRVVESVLDISHLPFVHPDTTGHDVSPVVRTVDYRVHDDGLVIHPAPFVPAHPLEPPRPYVNSEERVQIAFTYPNHWIIRAPVAGDASMCTYLTFTPLDDEHTRIFGKTLRNFAQDAEFLDDHHLSHTLKVMGEDQRIIESVRPRMAPADMRREAHVPSDVPALHVRRWLYDALAAESESCL
ncbi:hypothetical protein GCM10025857_32500 [Alicyclobacillus contaminans]|uniref:aromatic ring-hydroxylating oxygenase subunit alpha n=1 Tax=Alicyclobacillus contaminans TaxID=392016 RepID=UPI001FE1EF9B|nr:aromatic ring-hydroxylating dioxygenase subunit alpha [Alicyclobacillus contaminans]GMA51893.1 hypothetical protein GCM10025857_32500 [Alicyclobacillus contaminans]